MTNDKWYPVPEYLPDFNVLVWLFSSTDKTVCLGCRTKTPDGWLWAKADCVFEIIGGAIESDCFLEDMNVTHYQHTPNLPTF